VVLLLATLAAAPPRALAADPAPRPTTVTVFAAASLAEPFEQLGRLYRRAHPGREVRFSFAGSQQLVAQLEQGAEADVFASADERWMKKLASRSMITGVPREFARNRMAVIVPSGNPGRVRGPDDLARQGLRLVLCDLQVPAGFYARQVLANLGGAPGAPPDFALRASANIVSREENVKAVLGKVRLGEAEAGIVYHTDAAKARGVRILPLPVGANVTATYPVAVLARAPQPEAAQAFMDLLLSPNGQAVLARHGFLPPADAAK
jgi:molybdate transport system substrate-binding protein